MALVHPVLSDFVLFPREQSFFESMSDERIDDSYIRCPYPMDSDLLQEFPNMYPSTYTPYPNTLACSAQSSGYDPPQLVVDGPKDTMKSVHARYTPSASPSNSMSHSLEHAPSVLSTASAQSTASSAVGSPFPRSAQHFPGPELWIDPHDGLCITQNIGQNDAYSHDPYPSVDLESHRIMNDGSKFPGSFVGESQDISSTLESTGYIIPSPISFSSTSRSVISSTFPSPPVGSDTSVRPRHVTIDTILEEANDKMGTPASSTSPASTPSSVQQSPVTAHQVHPRRSPKGAMAGFRSPVTPASAVSPFASRASSPFVVRQHEPRRRFSGSRGIVRTQSTPPITHRSHPYERSNIVDPASQGLRGSYQTPFFNQSSGRFIPPLESSCWFSLRILPSSFH